MAITFVVDPTFVDLNRSSRNYTLQNVPVRERRVVSLVTLTAESYVTGGIVLDASKIARFKRIYVGSLININDDLFVGRIIIPTDQDSSNLKFKIFRLDDGTEVANAFSITLSAQIELYGQ